MCIHVADNRQRLAQEHNCVELHEPLEHAGYNHAAFKTFRPEANGAQLIVAAIAAAGSAGDRGIKVVGSPWYEWGSAGS